MSLTMEEKKRIALLIGDCPRQHLKSGLPREVELCLSHAPKPLERIHSDLEELLPLGPMGGRRPAAIYLENAAIWLDPRPEAGELRVLAARIDQGRPAVLCMNERVPAAWAPLYPGAEVIQIHGPHSVWHRDAEPGKADWHTARAAIDDAVDRLAIHKARHGSTPVAVFASTAFALAAYLGNRVRALCEARVTFYQPVGNPKTDITTWFDFGPQDSPGASTQPVIEPRGTHTQDRDPTQRALVVEITHRAVAEQVQHGLDAAGAPNAVIETIGVAAVGHTALAGRPDIDRAAADLRDAVDAAARRPEVEAVHLFYIGPAALLMRAAHKFHVLPRPLIVHERGPGNRFRPAIRFADNEVTLLKPA